MDIDLEVLKLVESGARMQPFMSLSVVSCLGIMKLGLRYGRLRLSLASCSFDLKGFDMA